MIKKYLNIPKGSLYFVALLLIIYFVLQNTFKDKEKHALIIGIDGALVEAVLLADTPHLDSLMSNGSYSFNAYCGGELGTETQQKTSSGPGWSSILTGVWVNKHQVPDNDFKSPNYDVYPHFFQRIKEKRPDFFLSSIVNWKPINEQILRSADFQETGSDYQVAQKAAQHLLTADPDVLFLQFDEVDGAGHKYGYSDTLKTYFQAISKTDDEIGIVLKALRKRENFDFEDWLIIVTTDHGGKNTGHGGQEPEVRKIFFIVSGGDVNKGQVDSGPGMVAVPPTVLRHLEIEIDPAWGWESKPFGW